MLRTLLRLPSADALMLARAAALVGVTRVALWVVPYRWVQGALDPRRAWNAAPADPAEAARFRRRVVWAVGAAARRMLPKKPCLTQALVARWLLARGGQPAEMKIGVTFGDRRDLLAHAWLEQGGQVILGGADSPARYTPLRAVGAGAT